MLENRVAPAEVKAVRLERQRRGAHALEPQWQLAHYGIHVGTQPELDADRARQPPRQLTRRRGRKQRQVEVDPYHLRDRRPRRRDHCIDSRPAADLEQPRAAQLDPALTGAPQQPIDAPHPFRGRGRELLVAPSERRPNGGAGHRQHALTKAWHHAQLDAIRAREGIGRHTGAE